jgi:hypothetical protein
MRHRGQRPVQQIRRVQNLAFTKIDFGAMVGQEFEGLGILHLGPQAAKDIAGLAHDLRQQFVAQQFQLLSQSHACASYISVAAIPLRQGGN